MQTCVKNATNRCPFKPDFTHRYLSKAGFAIVLCIAAASAYGGATFTTVFEFPGAAAKPGVALVKASDGNFYGTTSTKGGYGKGAIYRVTPQGQIITIYSFTGATDGTSPSSSLVQGPDGNLWGTTSFNNNNTTYGTIYKVTLNGSLTTVHTFTGPDGQFPAAELVLADDGNLYGTLSTGTSGGGASSGAVYSITTAGSYKIIYSFKFTDPGSSPKTALIKAKDGNFYGTTSSGQNGFPGGTVFKLTPAGTLTTLHSFTAATEGSASGKLVEGSDGNFYGTTSTGGANNRGTAFKVTPAGAFTLLKTFGSSDGSPGGIGLVQASDGNFYGTSAGGGAAGNGFVFRLTPAGDYTAIYNFSGVPDGANPNASLIDGGDGFLYGTTSAGAGDREAVFRGDGTVFKIALNGTFKLIAPFASAPSGKEPSFPLIRRPEGDLVGIALRGGEKSFGTFFTVSSTGEFKVAYNFDPDLKQFHPINLARGADGAFYGFNFSCLGCGLAETEHLFFKVTTAGEAGVINTSGGNGAHGFEPASLALGPDGAFYGVNTAIVRLTPTGEATILYQFPDSAIPGAAVFTPAGKLIGTTLGRGSSPHTIFLFDPATGAFSTVYTFKPGEGQPLSKSPPLVIGTDGNFYGTTQDGGTAQQGSVFKVTPAGEFTVLYSFTNGADGLQPAAALIQATDGNFYGTTVLGGAKQGGTIFSITPSGALTTLYSFPVPGGNPNTPLTQAKDGSFYGVTADGGVNQYGSIFRLAVSGVPPIAPQRLLNISTRMRVLTDENVLIGGFIITGSESKRVIIRGLGPSVPVEGKLQDTTLELFNGSGTSLATNDNWRESQEQEIRDTTIPPSNDLESAIVRTLTPGNYTVILRGKNNTSGVGLVEVYDLAVAAASQLANISTRGFVDTGNNVIIGGMIVGGGSTGNTANVLIRAIGPSLSAAGVNGSLQDPTLELHNADGSLISVNDNWKEGGQEQAIRATTIPPKDDRESAIIQTLAAGNYTAIVRGKNDTTGVGLVEVYNLQ